MSSPPDDAPMGGSIGGGFGAGSGNFQSGGMPAVPTESPTTPSANYRYDQQPRDSPRWMQSPGMEQGGMQEGIQEHQPVFLQQQPQPGMQQSVVIQPGMQQHPGMQQSLMQPSMQQQQQQQQTKQQKPRVQPPSGSYAQRSAQAYAQQPVQQQQFQQYHQQQPNQYPQQQLDQPNQQQQFNQQPNQNQHNQYQHQQQFNQQPINQQQQFQQPNQQVQQPQQQFQLPNQQLQQPANQQQQFQQPQQPSNQQQFQQPNQQQQQYQQFPITPSVAPSSATVASAGGATTATNANRIAESPAEAAIQNRLLTDATRKVQEHAYYMRQGMEKNDLPTVLDRASLMVGQLGENHAPQQQNGPGGMQNPQTPHGGEASQLNPKNYYELHMRALEDMPNFEEYLLNISSSGHTIQQQSTDPNMITITMSPQQDASAAKFSMRELYDCVQYCPQVLPRLYLQISAGSALIRSGEVGNKWVMNDLVDCVKCVQNPLRGLFLRHFLLQVLRDKLPDQPAARPSEETSTPVESVDAEATGQELPAPGEAQEDPEHDKGTVVDSYKFILANFIEMNKLWVRIQHLPGDGKSKEQRKRRERERNDLRILVGTNLVRLSQLEGVTSQIYGEVILPTVLEHIVVCGDPLAQAYLIDCITQVFPDEYHIETLPILLRVCPRLRDKVNIRTILQSLMDRLANYLADEELLDETDTNQVKKNMAQDSFPMFEECVQNVYNARGPKLTAKEVIRLQTALLSYSLGCFKGDMAQVNRCLRTCVSALRQANASYEMREGTMSEIPGALKPLDEVATGELEKLLSIPLDSFALKVLQLDHYAELIAFLPWNNRREVAIKLLRAVDTAGAPPASVKEIQELFLMVEPVIRDEYEVQEYGGMVGPISKNDQMENAYVAKLVHLLDNKDSDVVYEMLTVARQHISKGGSNRMGQTLIAVVYATFCLAQRIYTKEHSPVNGETKSEDELKDTPTNDTEGGETQPDEKPEEATENAREQNESEVTEDDDKVEETGSKEDDEDNETKEINDAVDDDTGKTNGAAEKSEEDSPKGEQEVAKTGAQNAGDLMAQLVPPDSEPESEAPAVSSANSISCRKLFVFLQQTINMLAQSNPEMGFKLYLQTALTADRFAGSRTAKSAQSELLDLYGPMPSELFSQGFALYEQAISDPKVQQRCIACLMGALMECKSLTKEAYERLITKTAQFSAKVLNKPKQCELVAQCAHLFYPAEKEEIPYRNAQRALECLQRALKLADACTSTDPENIFLFVGLLDHYFFFFEKKNPVITHAYVTGLVALVKEHFNNVGGAFGGQPSPAVSDAKAQFLEIVRCIKLKKEDPESAEYFAPVSVD